MKREPRGIALMIVLSTLVLLTTFAVEFAYDSNVTAHLASNDKQRAQAEYLAKSSYNFMLLELRFDKVFRQAMGSQAASQFLTGDLTAPLCKQFPVSTGMLRYLVLGEGEAPAGMPQEATNTVSLSTRDEAKEFLDFEGDFDGECVDEATRINLNMFALLNPDAPRGADNLNDYDKQKRLLVSFLKQPSFELLFKDYEFRPEDIVANIADWVDSNEQMNPEGGTSSASERSMYDKLGIKYPVHSSKMISKDEAYLIMGVDDIWFGPIEDSFTIYGGAGINICGASDFVIASIISRFFQGDQNFSGIRIEQPEIMEKLVTAVHDGCAQGGSSSELKKKIAESLWNAIGQYLSSSTLTADSLKPFTDNINMDGGYYTLINTGQVGETTVRIKAVVDARETDPQKWKLLYWRMY